MNKKLIKLTESDLHRIVKESVNKVLLKEDSDENVYNQVKMLRDRFDNIYRNSDYLKPGYEELVGGEDIQNAYFKVTNRIVTFFFIPTQNYSPMMMRDTALMSVSVMDPLLSMSALAIRNFAEARSP